MRSKIGKTDSNVQNIDSRLCISVPEAAAMLGVSRNFAYELVKRGELPVIKLGKRLLIPRTALEKMVERGMPSEQQVK